MRGLRQPSNTGKKPEWANPIRMCVQCIYRVGYGYTTIGKLTGCNKSLCRKWVKKAGIERGFIKSSRPLNSKKMSPVRNEEIAMARFDATLNKCLNRSLSFFTKDEKRREYQRRYFQMPQRRALGALRMRMWKTIREQGGAKLLSLSKDVIGCNRESLMQHLSAQFRRGMSWDNYGSVWEIDHKQPCSSFNLLDESQQRQCFHYSNLQPLFVTENRRKHSKIIPCQPELLLSV